MDEDVSKESRKGKYLTFRLGDEQYGLGILSVKEIIGMMPVTALPQAPSYMIGVINLRGKVIAVIDLRLKFAMAARAHTERTCIIVVETTVLGGCAREVGIVVDEVSEVLYIKEENIEDAPQLGGQDEDQVILGMAKEESGVKILLDINNALNGSQDMLLEKAGLNGIPSS